MQWADLHMHSRASDGAYAPAYLMELAALRGLAAVALTDHDTVAGLDEAEEAAGRLGIRFLPGIELDASHHRGSMHILGYGMDRRHPRLVAHLAAARNARGDRNRRILQRLRELGFSLVESSVASSRPLSEIGRPHIAAALVRAGIVRDHRAAFRDLLGETGAAFVRGEKPRPAEAIAAIRESGGVAVLAHAFTLGCQSDLELDTVVAGLVDSGLAGLEVRHPSHDAARERRLTELVKRYDLIATGGSDLHFVPDRQARGIGFGVRVDARVVSEIVARCAACASDVTARS